MSLAGITTLQSTRAQPAGLELSGSHMALNSKELKRREVFKKALDFPFFTLKEGRLLTATSLSCSKPSSLLQMWGLLGGAQPCSDPGAGFCGQGLMCWASPQCPWGLQVFPMQLPLALCFLLIK